jgi:hypothetical protein
VAAFAFGTRLQKTDKKKNLAAAFAFGTWLQKHPVLVSVA